MGLPVKRKKSILRHWILTYGCIVFLCLGISAVMYNIALSELKKEVLASNTAILNQARLTIDRQFADIENLALNIMTNNKVDLFMRRQDKAMHYYYSNFEAYEEIKKLVWPNDLIDHVGVYNHRMEKVISSDGMYTLAQLYLAQFSQSTLGYDELADIMSHTQGRRLVPAYCRDGGSPGQKILYTLGYTQSAAPFSIAMVQINADNLLRSIKEIDLPGFQGIVLFQGENTILSSSLTQDEMPIEYEKLAARFSSGEEVVALGENLLALSLPSSGLDIRYILLVSSAALNEKAEKIQWLTIGALSACFLLGALLIYSFSKRNYVPIRALVRTVETQCDAEPQDTDEFSYIHRLVDSVLTQNKDMRREIAGYNEVLRNNVLGKLLKGRDITSFGYQRALQHFNVPLGGRYYVVILLYVGDADSSFCEEEGDRELMRHVLRKAGCEALQPGRSTSLEIDGMEALILNMEELSELDTVSQSLDTAAEYLKEYHRAQVNVAIGGAHETLQALSQSYYEALEVLEYRAVTGNRKVNSYSILHSFAKSAPAYRYSIEQEQKLINFVRAAQMDDAIELVKSVLDDNIRDNTPLFLVRCIVIDLFCTILKIINELSRSSDTDFEEILAPYELLNTGTQASEIRALFIDWLDCVKEKLYTRKDQKRCGLFEELREFILRNYCCPDLNIEMTSRYFEMNPIYISRLFKENTGVGMLEFINHLRIERAKELLKDMDMKIGEIAGLCGFYNHASFTRKFKSVTGVSPNAYRELHVLSKA